MHKMLEWIKAHPYASAAIVFVVGLILILMFAGGGGSAPANGNATVGPDDNVIAANASLVGKQIDAQSQALAIGAQQNTVNNQTGAQLALGLKGLDVQNNNQNLQAQVALAVNNSQTQTAQYVSNLQAMVATRQLQSNDTLAALQANLSAININAQSNLASLQISTALQSHLSDNQYLAAINQNDTSLHNTELSYNHDIQSQLINLVGNGTHG